MYSRRNRPPIYRATSQGWPHREISRHDAASQKRYIHHLRTYELQSSKLVSNRRQRRRSPPRPSRRRTEFQFAGRARAKRKKKKKRLTKSLAATSQPCRFWGRRGGKSQENVLAAFSSWVKCRIYRFQGRGSWTLSRHDRWPGCAGARFPSANLQSHANPRKIIFQLNTPVPPGAFAATNLVSYFCRLILFRRSDAKLWISGDRSTTTPPALVVSSSSAA